MKKILLLLCAAVCAFTSAAKDFEVNGITYTITSDSDKTCETKQGEVTIESGYIEWYLPGNPVSGDIVIPSVVEYEGEIYTVTAIGQLSFVDNPELTGVTLPETITSIGNMAFYYCRALKTVNIPASVTNIGSEAFNDCDALESVSTPSLESWCAISFADYIGNPLYHSGTLVMDNEQITDLVIPSTVSKISANSFAGFKSLKTLDINDSVTEIGADAFYDCSALTEVTVGSGLTLSGNYAFYYCQAVEKVSTPDLYSWCGIKFGNTSSNPMSYGARLFINGTEATSLDIPEGVENINDGAFYKCLSVENIKLPQSLMSIGNMAFYGCSNLKSVEIPDKCWVMGTWAFALCSSLTDAVIPYAMASVPAYAFYSCESLENVNLPTTLTAIGNAAFASCPSLSEIVLPMSLKSLGVNAFYETSISRAVVPSGAMTSSAFSDGKVETVVLGCGVTQVGSYSFDSPTVPVTVYAAPKTAPSLDASAFSSYTASLYVPVASKTSYTSGNWAKFTKVYELVEPVGITMTGQPEGVLEKDMKFTLSAEISPSEVSIPDVVWESSNPQVASVDNYGNVTVTAISEGSCEITASTLYADGPKATFTVTPGQNGVSDIAIDKTVPADNNVYNMMGVCVKRNATPADITNLAPGLYIIGGKKQLVR